MIRTKKKTDKLIKIFKLIHFYQQLFKSEHDDIAKIYHKELLLMLEKYVTNEGQNFKHNNISNAWRYGIKATIFHGYHSFFGFRQSHKSTIAAHLFSGIINKSKELLDQAIIQNPEMVLAQLEKYSQLFLTYKKPYQKCFLYLFEQLDKLKNIDNKKLAELKPLYLNPNHHAKLCSQ